MTTSGGSGTVNFVFSIGSIGPSNDQGYLGGGTSTPGTTYTFTSPLTFGGTISFSYAGHTYTPTYTGYVTGDGSPIVTADLNMVRFLGTDTYVALESAAAIPNNTVTAYAQATFCLASGSGIATRRGRVAVEDLQVGDWVQTADGAERPVRWIGHRPMTLAGHPRPWDVRPVRVRQDAFGPGLPARDLVLSPDQAVFADGVLVPVRYLLNGASIAQECIDEITWWHVELDAHDVMLAEGLPVESFLNTGDLSAFDNGGTVVQARPVFQPADAMAIWAKHGCAELVMAGARLERVREALLQRLPALGFATTSDADLRVLAGARELAVTRNGEWLRVRVPDSDTSLRLISRTARPAELDAASNDWRELGIAVTGLRVDGAERGLEGPAFVAGWLEAEGAVRWTAGDARLAVPPQSVVEFRLSELMRYHVGADGAALRAA